MAYVMFQYDVQPTRCIERIEPAGQEQDTWFLQTSGAVSFVAYRTTDGTSPDTITMLEFRTVDDARNAIISVLKGLRSVGAGAEVRIVEQLAVHTRTDPSVSA